MKRLLLSVLILLILVIPSESALISPWINVDIGTPGSLGTADYNTSTSTFIVGGAGTIIGNQFNFTYKPITTDITFIARVSSISCIGKGRAGIIIKENLTAAAKYVSVYMDEGIGISTDALISTGGTALSIKATTALRARKAPMWFRIERIGSAFNTSYSTDGNFWFLANSWTVSMSSNAYVGLGVASQTTSLCNFTFDNVPVTVTPPSNIAPTVSINSPSYTTALVSPTFVGRDVTLSSNAADSDGQVISVTFLEGSTVIGVASTPPYTYTWTNVPVGQHTVFARATDNNGATTDSSTIVVSVNGAVRNVTSGANFTLYWDFDPLIDIDSFAIKSITGATVATDGTALKTDRQYTTSTTVNREYYIVSIKTGVSSPGSSHVLINPQ